MKKQLRGLLMGLAVQYLLGMATNLFVSFPESGTPEEQFRLAWSHVLSAAHIIVGLGLFVSSIIFLIRAIRAKQPLLSYAAWVGFLAILAAGLSGSEFVATQNDSYSYAMAVAFLVALLAYGWGLMQLKD